MSPFGAIEAGGTKFALATEDAEGHICARHFISTKDPATTLAAATMRTRNRSGSICRRSGAMAWSLALLAMLTACGSAEKASQPDPMPTSYTIRKADLYAASPADICRAKDAAFLNALVQRVSAALPPGTSSFDFVDFRADVPANGKAASAQLRFRTSGPDGAEVTMYASGPFNPQTCVVGPMTGGIGQGPDDPNAAVSFNEKGN
ncbi:hypothetical protein NSU_3734 [Novosphingobium pentaromativorans US6-1]|uniref:Uncharacterized protein n=3 Tax=Novosphingobium pentaromativorans TaxID=205844 RepID=G6EHB3_9SPHN|nr:hypothetical protein NSU_3734 [Novosphingobium pentaromativorans US6-1]